MNVSTTSRLLALSGLLVAAVVIVHASVPERPQLNRAPLAELPATIGQWQLTGNVVVDDESLKVLKADDYVSRIYESGTSAVDLFVAYYATQGQGDTMHSPMNCLPASGWQPMNTDRVQIATSSALVNANRVVIQKGLDKELMLYWYQSHGRTIASEYSSKAYLVLDSLRQHRSDAALVRLVTPLGSVETGADRAAADFVRALQPLLGRHIPD